MKIKIAYVAEIPDEELIEAGIDLQDEGAIEEYYYGMGAEDAYHSYGISFEINTRE